MYEIPKEYIVPKEVKDFQSDCDLLGMICDGNNWYITPEWAECFKKHLKKILPLAEAGDPWAQYNLGSIYTGGYQYSIQEEFESNYEADTLEGSKWLEKAARKGFVVAVDNLVVIGLGDEAERLREISKKVKQEHPEFIQKWEHDKSLPVILPSFFEKVWKIAYGNNS